MSRHALLGAVIVTTIACSPTPPASAGDAPPAESVAQCDASKVQELVGQQGSEDLATKARQLSGANAVRFLKPGQIVTMEYRADRLNIHVDEGNRVTEIRCG